MLGQDEHETDTKNRTSTNSASELTNPLEMVKKAIQALELLNSDVRDRSQALITMLGQDEHETDTKNRTSTNSASELTNLLEMVKKNQAFEFLNSDVRARSQALITILGSNEQESLNSDVRDRSQVQITMLGQDEHETDTKNRT